MTPRLETVEEIFHAALNCEPDQLNAFLDTRCTGDKTLRGKVQELLAAHQQAGSFIETPVADLARSSIADDHESELLINQTIGHYKISKLIGAGGMGAVYLAERADQQYKKQVAIKVIKRGMDTDSVLRHFRNERQILASFDHPNIGRLLDGGATESGLPYFVMEYVEGLPINTYCDAHALSITDRLKLFREVCAAVTYAHRHAVIHRDIKPSNILVTSDGMPKLLDFGIAKILQPSSGAEPLATMTGLRLMTPDYASPEQLRGEPVTTAAEVYSLGVVLYQMLTGQKPYRLKTQTPEEISRAIIEQEPPRPSVAVQKSRFERRDSADSQFTIYDARHLRGDLDNIVMMALRKEPERRYQSVEQFSEDIRRHLEVLPVRARKDTLAYRSAKFVRRNRTATAAAALVFLSLLGGIIATTWEAHTARAQEAVAEAEKNRAERRFNDVRQLAHTILFDYHDAIKDLPGATRVRERLVKDALVYLDSLASEAGGDPALQGELASAYDRIGDVIGGAYLASLGDRAGGMDSYQKALRIREALAAANPKDMQRRRDLAENYRRIGWQLRDTDQETHGVEHLRKSLMLYKNLTTEQPESAELQDEVAYTCNLVGLVLQDLGDSKNALDQHRQALALRQKLVSENPGERKYRRGLAATYGDMGSALLMGGDAAAAHATVRQALTLEEALVAEEPTNAYYRRILALCYGDDGRYLDKLGDKQGALESFRKSIGIFEQMMAADPANAQLYGDVGDPYRRAGDLLTEAGDNSQALEYYRKSLQVYENGSAKAPENLTLRLCVAICHAGVGKLQSRLGDKTVALDEFHKAIPYLLGTNEEAKNATHRSLKAQAYQYLGEAYAVLAASKEVPSSETTHHWSAARDMFQRSFDIWQDMRSRGILEVPDASKPEEVAHQIAKCDAFLGR
jgi:serine/threonine protein kinase